MAAVLVTGILSGMIAAIWLLANGGGFLVALAAYSGVGSAAVLASASFMVLRCRLVTARATRGEHAESAYS